MPIGLRNCIEITTIKKTKRKATHSAMEFSGSLSIVWLLLLTAIQGSNLRSCSKYEIFFDYNYKTGTLTRLMPNIVLNEQKGLRIAPVHKLNVTYATATFGMGCFWGAESLYGGTRGVIRTTVGYAGGTLANPTYRNLGNHTEVLEIDYDPTVVSYEQLLHLFWNNHEYGLTTPIKTQYMSLILYHTKEQQTIAEKSKAMEQNRRAPETVTTVIAPKAKFYPAEDYHQKYRLQGHRDLCATLKLNSDLLQTSYVATKLNGYLAGVGGSEQFKQEVDTMGLTPTQKEYCNHYVEKNQGHGLYC